MEIVDIKASVSSRSLILDAFFRNAEFLKDSRNRLISYVGGYSVVFPAIINGKKWAFRCWHVDPGATARKFQIISEQIRSAGLPYFTQFDYVNQGISVNGNAYPTIRMKWVEGDNLKRYILSHENDTEILNELAIKFLEMVRTLHENQIAHGDLQHENILVKDTGQLVLIDYDSMYLPALKGIADNDIIAGKPDYQHPYRRSNKVASEKLDYFSELVIFLSILGIIEDRSLIKKYQVADSEWLLFSAADYKDIKKSRIYADLYNLSSPFPELLGVLEEYLKQNNINRLKPFGEYFNFDWERYLNIKIDLEKDRKAWASACRKNTEEAYMEYIASFPAGHYVASAKVKIKEANEIKSYREQDDQAWKKACMFNTESHYLSYIQKFPAGANVSMAKLQIERLYWDSCKKKDTLVAYKDYLAQYPDGKYVLDAKNRITDLLDDKCWSNARKENSVEGYKKYLRLYPNARHKEETLRAIEEHTKIKKAIVSSGIIGVTIVLVIILLFFGIGYVRDKGISLPIPLEKSAIQETREISDIESETEKLIKYMEILKSEKKGASSDFAKAKAASEKNLQKLKQAGSPRYGELKSRYDRL